MFNRFANFMTGRRGMDSLNGALLGAAIVFSVIAVFAASQSGSSILRGASTLLLIAAVWRMFSRKTDARRKENEWFLSVTAGPRTALANLGCTLRGDKTHRFFACPGCRSRLRVPRGKGKIRITCPSCGTSFSRRS